MHQEVSNFIAEVRSIYPEHFVDANVLEVGSMNINGSIRGFFENCTYLGIDLGEGPEVDLTVPAHEFNRPERYDTIVCTEMLEHDQYWELSLKQMYKNLKPGGLLIITCAGPARHEHGTKRTTPQDSPFTTDYYRNISIEDFKSILPEDLFGEDDYHLELTRGDCDLQFMGIKEVSKTLPTLVGYDKSSKKDIPRYEDLIFVTAQPDDRFFVWEVETQILNLKKFGLSDKYKCLVYWEYRQEDKRSINPDWLDLKEKYPEVEFFFYKENDSELPIHWVKSVYSSIIRPYTLHKFFKANPQFGDKVVFYMDSDVIFLAPPPIEEYLRGSETFVTNTGHYLNWGYMRRKALEAKLPPDHFIDILVDITGVSKQLYAKQDKLASGGAQYVFKPRFDYADFWYKVMNDTIQIRQMFAASNQAHFQELGAKRPDKSAENAGIQSWCADMWAVYVNLIIFDQQISCPEFMRSVWSSDRVERLSPNGDMKGTIILHNAGIGGMINHKGQNIPFNSIAFDKTKYRWGNIHVGKWPWEAEDLSYVSPEYCSYFYVEALLRVIGGEQVL